MADASRQLCPARGAGAWASTPFRALQNALGSVAPSVGACGAPYAPAPDLPEERGGWRWRGVWRLRHIRPLQFSKSAVLNTGAACGARCAPVYRRRHGCGGFASAYDNAGLLFMQAWQTPPGSFALCVKLEHGHQRLSARCKTPLVLLPHLSGHAEHRMPRPLTFPKSAAAGAGAEYGACGISGPCNFPKARCLTPARHAAPAVRPCAAAGTAAACRGRALAKNAAVE